MWVRARLRFWLGLLWCPFALNCRVRQKPKSYGPGSFCVATNCTESVI